MPDDHSEVEPPLPIPNRAVKRFSADDSADSCAKVGHCQAPKRKMPQLDPSWGILFCAGQGLVCWPETGLVFGLGSHSRARVVLEC